MRLLVFGGGSFLSGMLKELIGATRHKLDWRGNDEDSNLTLSNYDMVLIDGSISACGDNTNLIEKLQRIKILKPEVPILVVSHIDGKGCNSGNNCGISRTADGSSKMHCRLRELACYETEALVRDVVNRPVRDPITFEYQG